MTNSETYYPRPYCCRQHRMAGIRYIAHPLRDSAMVLGITLFLLGSLNTYRHRVTERRTIVERAYADDFTATPSATPTPTVTVDPITAVIQKTWGKDWQTGMEIAQCESGLRTDATNNNTDGSTDQSVFQINSVHNVPNMMNPVANIEYAYQLYKEQGLTPWESSRHCWSQEVYGQP